MIGQDDILFQRDRLHTFHAGSELFTLRLDRDVFEKMLREFPDMKTEILDDANLRSLYARKQSETTKAIVEKESKLVIRKFNEVANEKNYEVLSHQREHALKRKEVLYRRSIEFVYKDKRLRNAIPPQEMDDGTGAKRFVSANPKLKKILERKQRKTMSQ